LLLLLLYECRLSLVLQVGGHLQHPQQIDQAVWHPMPAGQLRQLHLQALVTLLHGLVASGEQRGQHLALGEKAHAADHQANPSH
jgi:hypothetical protein